MFRDEAGVKEAFLKKLQTMYGKGLDEASDLDRYMAVGSMIRDYLSEKWVKTNACYLEEDVKQVYGFTGITRARMWYQVQVWIL